MMLKFSKEDVGIKENQSKTLFLLQPPEEQLPPLPQPLTLPSFDPHDPQLITYIFIVHFIFTRNADNLQNVKKHRLLRQRDEFNRIMQIIRLLVKDVAQFKGKIVESNLWIGISFYMIACLVKH